MSETQLTKLIFGIFLSVGSAVLLLIAFKLYYKYLVQEKKCTAKNTTMTISITIGLGLGVLFREHGRRYRSRYDDRHCCGSVRRIGCQCVERKKGWGKR